MFWWTTIIVTVKLGQFKELLRKILNDFQKHPLEVEEQHMFFIFVEVVTPVIAKRQKNMNI